MSKWRPNLYLSSIPKETLLVAPVKRFLCSKPCPIGS
ncbi:hypothetical protein ACVWZR_006563 [Bradyrhizobium sp. i1.3.1]